MPAAEWQREHLRLPSRERLSVAQDCSGNVRAPLSHLVSLFAPQALGSFYFLHESLKNIYQFDFKGKTHAVGCPESFWGSCLTASAPCPWAWLLLAPLPCVPGRGWCGLGLSHLSAVPDQGPV